MGDTRSDWQQTHHQARISSSYGGSRTGSLNQERSSEGGSRTDSLNHERSSHGGSRTGSLNHERLRKHLEDDPLPLYSIHSESLLPVELLPRNLAQKAGYVVSVSSPVQRLSAVVDDSYTHATSFPCFDPTHRPFHQVYSNAGSGPFQHVLPVPLRLARVARRRGKCSKEASKVHRWVRATGNNGQGPNAGIALFRSARNTQLDPGKVCVAMQYTAMIRRSAFVAACPVHTPVTWGAGHTCSKKIVCRYQAPGVNDASAQMRVAELAMLDC